MYVLKFRKAAIKALRRMRPEDARRVRAELRRLTQSSDNMSYHATRMKGRPEYKLRIGGLRVVYERNEETKEILVKLIGSRGDVYKHVHEEPGEFYDTAKTASNT